MKTIDYNDLEERHFWEFRRPYCHMIANLDDEPYAGDVVICEFCEEEIRIKKNKR